MVADWVCLRHRRHCLRCLAVAATVQPCGARARATTSLRTIWTDSCTHTMVCGGAGMGGGGGERDGWERGKEGEGGWVDWWVSGTVTWSHACTRESGRAGRAWRRGGRGCVGRWARPNGRHRGDGGCCPGVHSCGAVGHPRQPDDGHVSQCPICLPLTTAACDLKPAPAAVPCCVVLCCAPQP